MSFKEFKKYIKGIKKSVGCKEEIDFKYDKEQRLYKAYVYDGVLVMPENGRNLTWYRNGHCVQKMMAV